MTLALAVALVTVEARAAETGDLRGTVTDSEGQPLAGATILVSGPALAGTREVVSSDRGMFQVLALPPGQHRLVVSLGGYEAADLSVLVRLDETAFVPVTLEVPGAKIEIVVEGTPPVLDATRSAVSTELTKETLRGLPVVRSYQEALNILPGVYGRIDTEVGRPSSGNPAVRGEGAYGNNYLVDGISMRDPAEKTFGVDVPFDAIETLQVYTDGAPAEFGQATGMVVNVVTRDGGDEHHGSASYYVDTDASPGTYDIADLGRGRDVPTDKRDFLLHELATTAGGPIVRERLWYFTALTLKGGDLLIEGVDPDAPQLEHGISGLGKLSWFVSPSVTLQYELTGSLEATDNYLASAQVAPEAESRYTRSSLGHIGTLRWFVSPRSEIEVKASWLPQYSNQEPMSGDEDAAQLYDVETGRYTGNHDTFDTQTRSRLGTSVKWTWLAGAHRLKLGVEGWELRDSRELVFTGPGDGVQYLAAPQAGFPCTAPDRSDCYGYTEYTEVGEPLGHVGHVMSAFVQDDFTPWRPLTANVGFRVDREVLYQNEGDKFLDAVMPAPRLGLAWDVTDDSRTLLAANWGRYYDLAGNAFAAWGDTRSAYVFREYANDGAGNYDLVWEQNPETDPLVYCDEEAFPDGSPLYEEYCDGHRLRPYHMDKLVLGLQREVVPRLIVGVRGISSLTRDIPEDINIDDETWVIANPANKRRDYQAVELTVERAYDEVWQLLASYTLSASRGHMPGQFELPTGGSFGSDGNNVGVYMDDISDPATRQAYRDDDLGWVLRGLRGLGTATDDAGYYGYLPYHSFHQLKVSGYYTLPFGTTLGLVYELDSGHAWQKRGFVELYGDYYAFPEGRGARFMPPVQYVDVRAGHTFRIGSERELQVVLDLFNVLDLQTPIWFYENDNDSFGLTLYRQAPRAARLGLRYTY